MDTPDTLFRLSDMRDIQRALRAIREAQRGLGVVLSPQRGWDVITPARSENNKD
jgi:hypothetical protein